MNYDVGRGRDISSQVIGGHSVCYEDAFETCAW